MDNLDLLVLRTLRDWQRSGRRTLLATVVRTWGSSPRPVGSILAIADDGSMVGSVSGGCIEDDLADRAKQSWRQALSNHARRPATEFLKYGVTADEAFRFGLPCGGTVELLLENEPAPQAIEQLVTALTGGRLIRRTVRLEDGDTAQEETTVPQELRMDEFAMENTFGPEYRMLLIGAGQLSEYLASMAVFSGFVVSVCDPRVEYLRAWSVPDVSAIGGMPDDVVLSFRPDARTAVIALTHDPKLDDLALMEALHTPAFYVGAIGSRRNSEIRRQRLEEHLDVSKSEVARLRGPIGIFIGSKTPPEIAVSVMAEVLAVKNGVAMPEVMQVASAKNRIMDAEPR